MYMQNTVKLTGSLYYVTSIHVSSDFSFANHLIYKYFPPKTWSLFAVLKIQTHREKPWKEI